MRTKSTIRRCIRSHPIFFKISITRKTGSQSIFFEKTARASADLPHIDPRENFFSAADRQTDNLNEVRLHAAETSTPHPPRGKVVKSRRNGDAILLIANLTTIEPFGKVIHPNFQRERPPMLNKLPNKKWNLLLLDRIHILIHDQMIPARAPSELRAVIIKNNSRLMRVAMDVLHRFLNSMFRSEPCSALHSTQHITQLISSRWATGSAAAVSHDTPSDGKPR